MSHDDTEQERARDDDAAEHVLYSSVDGIGFIELHRPRILNAISDTTADQLKAALYALDDDDSAMVGIVHGSGRAFSSGADVRQRQLRPAEEAKRLGGPYGRGGLRLIDATCRATNWKPLIAATHGYVLGAALYLALQCDLIVASEDTQFQVTEVARGLPAAGIWGEMGRRGAGGLANDVALTGRMFSAEEAYRHGIVNRLVPPGEHLDAAVELASQVMANPPLAVRGMVRFRRMQLETADFEGRYAGPRDLHLTQDFRESATAFIESREAKHEGR